MWVIVISISFDVGTGAQSCKTLLWRGSSGSNQPSPNVTDCMCIAIYMHAILCVLGSEVTLQRAGHGLLRPHVD